MESGEVRRKRRVNGAKLKRFFVLLGCAYLMVMMARIVINQEQAKRVQRQDYQVLTTQIAEVKAKNEKLERQIEFAGTSAYIERVAREQLGYVREGEIKFLPEDDAPLVDGQSSGDGENGAPPDAGVDDAAGTD